MSPKAIKLIANVLAASVFGLVSTSTCAQEEFEVVYPMFEVGDFSNTRNKIEFFWMPSSIESSELFTRLIEPLIQKSIPALTVTFYLVVDPEDEEDDLDAYLGAMVSCVPPEKMPDFTVSILKNMQENSGLGDLKEMYLESKKFGNASHTFEECVRPPTIVKILQTSSEIKKLADIDSFPTILLNGEDLTEAESVDEIVATLLK